MRLTREVRYAAILEEATSVFVEMGYENASMTEVARRVGIVEGNIYRYFENKRDLLIKVVENWFEQALTGYEEQLEGIAGVRNRLRYMSWHHLSLIKKYPELCNLFVLHLRSAPDYEDTACYELNARYVQCTERVIAEGVEYGVFRQDVPVQFARDMIHGCVEYYALPYITRRTETFEVEKAADQITDLAFRALAANTEGPLADAVLERLGGLVDRLERAT